MELISLSPHPQETLQSTLPLLPTDCSASGSLAREVCVEGSCEVHVFSKEGKKWGKISAGEEKRGEGFPAGAERSPQEEVV